MTIITFYIFYWIVAAIGLTLGFHRCISHQQIKLHAITETLVLYIGVMASACSPLTWAGVHRMHHAYADTEKDPHSPIHRKWYQVLLSTHRVKTIPRKFVKDLFKNKRVMFYHKHRLIVMVFTYIVAAAINIKLLLFLLLLLPMSFICYGIINLFGHNKHGSVNVWWINLFAPFEGNHYDHHNS